MICSKSKELKAVSVEADQGADRLFYRKKNDDAKIYRKISLILQTHTFNLYMET